MCLGLLVQSAVLLVLVLQLVLLVQSALLVLVVLIISIVLVLRLSQGGKKSFAHLSSTSDEESTTSNTRRDRSESYMESYSGKLKRIQTDTSDERQNGVSTIASDGVKNIGIKADPITCNPFSTMSTITDTRYTSTSTTIINSTSSSIAGTPASLTKCSTKKGRMTGSDIFTAKNDGRDPGDSPWSPATPSPGEALLRLYEDAQSTTLNNYSGIGHKDVIFFSELSSVRNITAVHPRCPADESDGYCIAQIPTSITSKSTNFSSDSANKKSTSSSSSAKGTWWCGEREGSDDSWVTTSPSSTQSTPRDVASSKKPPRHIAGEASTISNGATAHEEDGRATKNVLAPVRLRAGKLPVKWIDGKMCGPAGEPHDDPTCWFMKSRGWCSKGANCKWRHTNL